MERVHLLPAVLAALTLTTPTYSVSATSYCLRGTMADGTYTRHGSVANNFLPLGAKIKLLRPRSFHGRRYFHVRDRIGWGTQLDLWSPTCAQARRFGRQRVV